MHDGLLKALLGQLFFFLPLDELSDFSVVHLRAAFLAGLLSTV